MLTLPWLARRPSLPALNRLVAALVFACSVSAAHAEAANAGAVDPNRPKGERVFTAGHSFHAPIAQPLAAIAKLAGIQDHVLAGRQVIGGSTVTQHWNAKDAKHPAKEMLAAGKVDVLTLSPHLLMPDPGIDKFVDLMLQHNKDGRVLVQSSWIPRDGNGLGSKFNKADRDKATFEQLDAAQRPATEKVRQQVDAINAKYADTARRPVAFVVPVGEAVNLLRQQVIEGKVPGIARQTDLFRDDLGHGNLPVYILNAYCHYAVIYKRSPVGLGVPESLKLAGLDENLEAVNKVLQECAWQAVTSEPGSGLKGE